MKISIIGASNGVGLEVVKRSLERNHEVTTLSRTKFSFSTDGILNQIIGDALKAEDLKKAIHDADAILVTLGTRNSAKATTLYTDFAQTLLSIHQEKPITVPVIVLTGFGAGESHQYLPFYMRWVFNIVLKDVYQNKTQMEKMIVDSDLSWTIVRPGVLTNGSLTEKYRISTELMNGIKSKWISRADVADAMVKEAEKNEHRDAYIYLI